MVTKDKKKQDKDFSHVETDVFRAIGMCRQFQSSYTAGCGYAEEEAFRHT